MVTSRRGCICNMFEKASQQEPYSTGTAVGPSALTIQAFDSWSFFIARTVCAIGPQIPWHSTLSGS